MGKQLETLSGAVEQVNTRFWAKVDRSGSCWAWTAGTDGRGYGMFWTGAATKRANRVAYERFVAPIPPGVNVPHRCDNPLCVRPDHLFLGTHADNVADRVSKGRSAMGRTGWAVHPPTGEKHHSAKLTNDQVAEIRERHARGETNVALAKQFGVSRSLIWRIVRNMNWRRGTV